MKIVVQIFITCLLCPIYVSGQVDNNSINEILNHELNYVKKLNSFDSISVNSDECQKNGKEHNEFHDFKYRPALPEIIDYLIKTQNDTLISLFIKVVSFSTGSADETQIIGLARLYIGLPDIVYIYITSYDSPKLSQYLKDAVEWYLESSDMNENDRGKYRQKIKALNN